MRLDAPRFLVAAAFLLPAVVAAPQAIPPGAPGDPTAYPSPHEFAYAAVERLQTSQGLVPERSASTNFLTRDQMIAVVAHLHQADLFPHRAADHVERAEAVWDAAQTAWDPIAKFYDVTLASDSQCVQLETTAWALLAASRLDNATDRPEVQTRAADVAATLRDAVVLGRANGVNRCQFDAELPSQWPLPVWALLEYARTHGSAAARDAALARLRAEIAARYEEAFLDLSGLYLVQMNAQYLLVLQEAAQHASPAEFGPRRDDLAAFLGAHALVEEPGLLLAYDVDAATLRALHFSDSIAQLWLAYALHNQVVLDPTSIPVEAAPQRLLAALVSRFAANDAGGFVDETGAVHAALNTLAAAFTLGPALAQANADKPRLAFVVPAVPDFQYPNPGAPNAKDYYLRNSWDFRFTLDPQGPGAQSVLLPLPRLGPRVRPPASTPCSPSPALNLLGGAAVPSQTTGNVFPILQFPRAASTEPLEYRLTAYAPVYPVASANGEFLLVRLRSDAPTPFEIDNLRLELALDNVKVDGIRLNDQLLPRTSYELTDVTSTDYLPEAHERLELFGTTLRAGQNEIRILYTDIEKPVVESVEVSKDAAGRNLLDLEGDRYRLGPTGVAYVRARVADNAGLRSVTLRLMEGNGTDYDMERSPEDPDVYVARVPGIPQNAPTTFQIRAVDGQGNLNDTVLLKIQAESTLLQEGNLILLVFSGTLFVTAVVIYVKMGRRRSTKR